MTVLAGTTKQVQIQIQTLQSSDFKKQI